MDIDQNCRTFDVHVTVVVNILRNYNKQDAPLYNILYYSQCSTCFRRFLCPSSGAQNFSHSIGCMSSLFAATASDGSKQERRNFLQYSLLLSMLYMFQVVSPPIIRSSKLYTQHRVYVKLACCYRLR